MKKIIYTVENTFESSIQIECSDETIYECDHLICTLPLGVLKKYHMNIFQPLLNRRKVECIESMAFGTVGKIYVEFSKPFWDKDWEGISFLWKPEQLKQIVTEDSTNSKWMKKIIGFYTVSFQPNILCGWISGNAARKMELVSDEEFEAGVKRVLKMFFKSQINYEVKNIIRYIACSNYNMNVFVIVVNFFRTKWNSNPHFFGSYTYYSLKSDAFGTSTSTLAEPVLNNKSEPLIQFAGEATSKHYYSTVHGAISTGWREAQRLIDFYTKK